MDERIRNLWAVTDGEYSDFRVVAVFEREQDAREAMNRGLGDDVQELPYCPAGVLPRRVTVHRAQGNAYRAGRLGDVAVRVYSTIEWQLGENPAPRRPRIREYGPSDGRSINVIVECANAALAEKALRDRLARLYAEWEGLT